MTNQGMHAADDGSLARSTGGAAARGAMLIALALIIGLLLMAFALDDPPTDLSTATNDNVAASDDTGAEPSTDDAASEDSVNAVDPEDVTEDAVTTPVIDEDDIETIPDDVEAPADGAAFPAAEVNVLVANGTGAAGVAGSVSDKLKAAAYIAVVSNAPSTAEAVIYYRVGYDANAREVADLLGAPPDIITPAPGDGTIAVAADAASDGRLAAANVVVIIGADNAIPVG